ncbi:hypothetical protein [Chitinivibrio alkaliphilus]|uniref:Prepilin-type N-terminal cleavage/methylation domain-containing protein n=1 Tax=Chitinivibrio alkaliphilus ACht1 TaxID=1313304 RepID=U7D804_9BACT|nr:hypothetical protein [Chitinivibrio alkaliphilus]ERP39085.1 hypothetical protein CALK_0250 [Chitinivibrio alkaliphilus ACht1]
MKTTNPLGNSRGVTLVELIVYMVVSLFVVTYSLDFITSLLTGAEHERRVVDLQHSGTDLINIISRDMGTMGFKHYLIADTVDFADTVDYREEHRLARIPGTWTGSFAYSSPPDPMPNDSAASFLFIQGDASLIDTLTFFRGVMETIRVPERVEQVSYTLSGDSLYRRITPLDIDLSSPPEPEFSDWDATQETVTVLADNVVALTYEFSPDFQTWTDDPEGGRHTIRYVRVTLLVRSSMPGGVVTERTFEFPGDREYTPPAQSKNVYRKYESIIEVPSNGIL